MSIDGILNVNKPEGTTSFSVVSLLKFLSHEKRVGHAGTLDPMASGVLPICLGQATRVVEFLTNCNKTYIAQIELGAISDTLDREGIINICSNPVTFKSTQVERALRAFIGTIEQVPPRYSALKHKGEPYYALARKGVLLDPKPRTVTIFNIDLMDLDMPVITIKVTCSKGTYIRSLAHDIGQYLGCGAYLRNLTRTQCGTFVIEDALPLSEIKCIFHKGIWEKYLYPVDIPLVDWQTLIIDEIQESTIRNGKSVPVENNQLISEPYCRAYNKTGKLIALLELLPGEKMWHPKKVFTL